MKPLWTNELNVERAEQTLMIWGVTPKLDLTTGELELQLRITQAGHEKQVSKEIYYLKEIAIVQALKQLGWTPPPE